MNTTDPEQLVRDTIALTGSVPPQLLDDDAPILQQNASASLYLVGLIGGKEVGKSALVNALAGAKITDETSHGPGTQTAIAYVHRSHQAELSQLLEREVPGKFTIVPHDQAHLGGQVLLDLPDIDSRFASHVEVTRRMLRHMLFPIWIQSVEKYADVQPQNLLAKVAAGNDPGNFLFCLNKVDQLPAGEQAAELSRDYSRRIGRVLALPAPPRVYMIAARQPGNFDLPELSKLLSREKSPATLANSRELATRRKSRSLLTWLIQQDLVGRSDRLARLDAQASELLSERIGIPLADQVIPAIVEDSAYRLVMTDGVFARRVARWPIVNVLHSLLSPIRFIARENTAAGSFFGGADALINRHFKFGEQSVATLVQSAFAQLDQSDPTIAPLYERRKLWEPMNAQMAEAQLRKDLVDTVNRQREIVLARLSGKNGIIAPLFRMLLTIGALVWFPLIQPVLQIWINSQRSIIGTAADIGKLAVEVFSAASLLQNFAFLAMWYFLIWALLRWSTRRRVEKLLSRWKSIQYTDDSLNLAARTLQWMDDLLEPIRLTSQTTQRLAERVEKLQEEMNDQSKSAA